MEFVLVPCLSVSDSLLDTYMRQQFSEPQFPYLVNSYARFVKREKENF